MYKNFFEEYSIKFLGIHPKETHSDWAKVGINRAIIDDKPLDQSLGWEYEGCCWRIQVFGRRYISSRTGRTDNSISVQLGLNGFSDRSRSPEEMLDRGILGYRPFDSY